MADRTPDECIAKVLEVAAGNPDPCRPAFSAGTALQRWWLCICCQHGSFEGESQGLGDVSTAFLGAMSNYWRAHPGSAGAQA